jgi:REP element-mobilizing transposase RayT
MVRLPRYVVAEVPRHIIQRGNNRQATFADPANY